MKFSGKNFQPWPEFDLEISGLTILIGPSNEGKCLAPGTPVLMFDGTIKNVEDVRVGDLLMGPDSKPRRVLSLAHGFDEMYDIVPKKGDPWRCNSQHILPIVVNGKKLRNKCPKYRNLIEISVADFLKRGKWLHRQARLQRSSAIKFASSGEIFDPYFVGLWLGDGNTSLNSLAVTTADREVLDCLNALARRCDLELRENKKKGNRSSTFVFSGGRKWIGPKVGHSQNTLLSKFRQLGLIHKEEKRIPHNYKTASLVARRELLAGLLDSDGNLEGKKQFEFVSKLRTLAYDTAFIARSLGFRASVKPCTKTCQTGAQGNYFRVRIAGALTEIPTRIARKKANGNSSKPPLSTGFDVVPAGYGEYFGFEIDGDGLFLLGDFTITHNSSVYRALRGILRNEIDVAHIRDPKDAALELTLRIGEHTVTVVRSKKGSVRYVVNHPSFAEPKEYAKLDGDLPSELQALKFGDIKIGEYSVDPIFGDQNSSQFLIDPHTYKPGHLNAVLGAFGGTEKLEKGKKAANTRKTQGDGEAKLLATQIRDAEERKHKLDGLLVTGEPLVAVLRDLEKEIKALEAEFLWCERVLVYRKRLKPLRQLLESLILPDVGDIQRLQQASQYAGQAAEASAFARWLRKPLVALDGVSAPWSDIMSLWKQIRAISSATGILGETHVDTAELKPLDALDGKINVLLGLQTSIKHIEVAFSLRQELSGSAAKLADIEMQLTVAQDEVRKSLCPKCGRPLEHTCQ